MSFDVEPLGERALRITPPRDVDRAALLAHLRTLPGVIDVAVTEAHAVCRFDGVPPELRIDRRDLRSIPRARIREHVVRVTYDGPDLDEAAQHAGISAEAWAATHAALVHEVSFLGFMPGFAYLRGVSERMSPPRRAVPRERVPPRSLAVAGGFTGIYPFASPGGWWLVGLAHGFEPFEGGASTLRVGDRVRFERV